MEQTPAEVARRDQRRKTYADLAVIAHDLFVAFIVAGFNPEQALELTKQGVDFGYRSNAG